MVHIAREDHSSHHTRCVFDVNSWSNKDFFFYQKPIPAVAKHGFLDLRDFVSTDPNLLISIFQEATHSSHPQKTLKDLVRSYAWCIVSNSIFHLIFSSYFSHFEEFQCIFVKSQEILDSSWGFNIYQDNWNLRGEKEKRYRVYAHAWVWPHVSTGIMHSIFI